MKCKPGNSLKGRRGFAALVCAQFLGAVNDGQYKMIVSLLAVGAAGTIGSAGAYLSVTGIVFILPYLTFSGYAGFVADAFDKRTVLVATKLLEVAVMALALAAILVGRIELLLATLFLMAVQSTFFSPAKYGILPEMLPPALLARANGVLEMSRYVAVILGTAAGGALLSWFADRLIFLGAVLVAVACAGALASLAIDAVPRSGSQRPFPVNPWSEVATGFRRLADDRRLGLAVAGISYFEFMASLVLLDVLLIGKEMMGIDDLHTSLLAAFAGIGVGLGSFAAGKLSRDGIDMDLVPVGAFGVATAIFVTGFMTWNYAALVASVMSMGLFAGLFFVPMNAQLQHVAGREEKGHLIATNNFLNMLGVLVSCVVLWLLRDFFEIRPDRIMLLAGLMGFAVAVGLIWAFPEFRRAAASRFRDVFMILPRH